jgi:hypothetical protein
MFPKDACQINAIDVRHVQIKQNNVRFHFDRTAIGLFGYGLEPVKDIVALEMLAPVNPRSGHVIDHQNPQGAVFLIGHSGGLQQGIESRYVQRLSQKMGDARLYGSRPAGKGVVGGNHDGGPRLDQGFEPGDRCHDFLCGLTAMRDEHQQLGFFAQCLDLLLIRRQWINDLDSIAGAVQRVLQGFGRFRFGENKRQRIVTVGIQYRTVLNDAFDMTNQADQAAEIF